MNAVTKRDLVERGVDALDPNKTGAIVVSRNAGGVSFASALEVMEFSKLMSVADKAVPPHLRNNPGMCLAVTFQAVEWQMSPFAVANKSYVVNDRIGYESQLVHAVIEARAPLQKRLRCSYSGDGETRRCKVWGMFLGEDDPHEYESPMKKDIKVQNSPLWKADLDQQLFYYSSRSWARKWCPDVLMGIYTKDDLEQFPEINGGQDDGQPGVIAKLVGVDRQEGHQPGHVDAELANTVTTIPAGKMEILPPKGDASNEAAKTNTPKTTKATKAKGKTKAAEPEPEHEVDTIEVQAEDDENPAPDDAKGDVVEVVDAETGEITEEAAEEVKAERTPLWDMKKKPRNADDYSMYAREWISTGTDADSLDLRWGKERSIRNDVGVTSEDRAPIQEFLNQRTAELRGEAE